MIQALSNLTISNGDITVKIDFNQTRKTAVILRALNHKLRQQIIKLLNETTQLTVTDVYEKLNIEQSVASQHLAILRRANIVLTIRDGKYIYYGLNYVRVNEITRIVKEFVG